ncbi:MAG: flagellar hook-basal body complex protein FliE [Gaiellales bacterium]
MALPPVTGIGLGPEFAIPKLDGAKATTGQEGVEGAGGFGKALGSAFGKLVETQQTAMEQSQALALGKAPDIQTVAIDVERANLAIQLATQVRNRAVDAYHEIFRMQV